jgi:mannose-6-phosphate isomerase-like protein (cupin superfamily)
MSERPGDGRAVRFDASAWRFAAEKMQKLGLFASDTFFLDLYCLEPGQAQKPHAHERSAKVYLVLEGRARVTLGDSTLELGPGEDAMAEAGEVHGIANDFAARLVALTFMAPLP